MGAAPAGMMSKSCALITAPSVLNTSTPTWFMS
jgi:hypothetical protein